MYDISVWHFNMVFYYGILVWYVPQQTGIKRIIIGKSIVTFISVSFEIDITTSDTYDNNYPLLNANVEIV